MPPADKPKPVVEPPSPLEAVGAAEMDLNAGLLTEEDMAEIKAAALAQFNKERKAAAKSAALRNAVADLERVHGKRMLGGHLDDLVSITVNLPENSAEVIIDQERIAHGSVLVRPRHVINSILETMWRGQVADHNLSGKKRDEFYRRQRPVEVTKSGFQVHEGMDLGAETVMVA